MRRVILGNIRNLLSRRRDVLLTHNRKLSLSARITTQTIDGFVTQRQTERGKKLGSKVSPATVNRELRTLKSALRIAADWGYLVKIPKFRKVKEPEKMGSVVTPEHFQAIYEACKVATMPDGHPSPAEWWQALLVFAITHGLANPRDSILPQRRPGRGDGTHYDSVGGQQGRSG